MAPLFGAFHALTIDGAGGGAGASCRRLAAVHAERVMNAIQHAVALAPSEVVVDCAARREVLGKVAPLAASAQDTHRPVHDRAHVCSPLASAALGWWNERFDKPPFVVRQVARVSQVIATVSSPVLIRSHRQSLLHSPRLRCIASDSKKSAGFKMDSWSHGRALPARRPAGTGLFAARRVRVTGQDEVPRVTLLCGVAHRRPRIRDEPVFDNASPSNR